MKSIIKIFLPVMLLLSVFFVHAQETEAPRFSIGTTSTPTGTNPSLQIFARFQQFNASPTSIMDRYDRTIHSPKSVNFSRNGEKFYVHSLEGFTTSIYDTETMTQIKVIEHIFTVADSNLFVDNESTLFDYLHKYPRDNHNIFKGKPVESCFSHHGRYLWVTYYRRDWDPNAECPSAVAIIDTRNDSVVRVMPTGPLPKMIACSPDNRYIAVTHWGDNTVGIIDISSDTVQKFKYVAHLIVDNRVIPDFFGHVNRDANCGHCLRGTVFSPNSNYLLVGKMGGAGGIALFDIKNFTYLGTVKGTKSNLRHMVMNNGDLIVSTNVSGFVQRTPIDDLINALTKNTVNTITYTKWKSRYIGKGVRTIDVTADGKYIFACVNNECKVAVIRSADMKLVCTIDADAYPVGMALSPDGQYLVSTSQGRNNEGGNSVIVYKIHY